MTQDAAIILLTLKVAGTAVALALPPGLLLSAWLARRRFAGRAAIETCLSLPLVLPPVATGLVLLMVLSPSATVGRFLESAFGLRLVFSWPGAALAAAVVSFPLMLRSLLQGFESIDPRYADVARTLGASRLSILWRIHLPLIRPAIVAGCLLTLARSLGEFGATIILAGSIPGRTRTVALELFQRIEVGDTVGALRMALLAVVMAFALLSLGRMAERRLLSGSGR
ncbi:MAG: molybdate ABC transporter permease subunit [Acidobacteriota bacterium]